MYLLKDKTDIKIFILYLLMNMERPVDLATLKDAQANPEAYRQLVVRIWGWSAYFVELDKDFQDHVMARQEYSV